MDVRQSYVCWITGLLIATAHYHVYGCNLNLVIALDSSASLLEGDPLGMPYHNWNLLKDFSSDLISELSVPDGTTRVGLVVYSSSATSVFDLEEYGRSHESPVAAIRNEISNLQFLGGSTNTADAIREARDLLEDFDGGTFRRVILLLTDGLSNDRDETLGEAREARAKGIEIYTVGISEYVDVTELRAIASSHETVLYLQDFSELSDTAAKTTHISALKEKLCVFTPCENDGRLDIAFLMDSSGSIAYQHKPSYTTLKNFVKELIDLMPVSRDQNRIAALIFSIEHEILFTLDEHTNKEDIKEEITNAPALGQETNIAEAFRLTSTQIFNVANGDRPDVPNVIVLITDGGSTEEEEHTLPEAQRLKDEGTIIYAVGITESVDFNMTELQGIASVPHYDYVFLAENPDDLQDLVTSLVRGVCTVESGSGEG